jgi:uncharacterized protein
VTAGQGRDSVSDGASNHASEEGGMDRDRDAAGRPRNARLRDGLGRPLPRSADTGTERVPDDLEIVPAEAAALGASLLAEGRPFHAHEVFEAAWKTGPHDERELWQGLAQLAVGITHARRGNPKGAVSLLRRGAQRVSNYAVTAPDRRPYGIDLAFVISNAEGIAATVERDGLPAVSQASLWFPLSA